MKQIKILILLSSLFILTPYSLFATTWNTAGDGLSAATSPSPYDDDTDITTTLSISTATALSITVTGETERQYDFLYITDEAGNTQTFDDNINTTYTVTGSSITLRFTSDYSIRRDGVTVTIRDASPLPAMNTFAQRYITNLRGNLKVIGNTVLQSPNPTSTNSNADLTLFYTDVDNSSTYNSSSATITSTEGGVDISNARITWAGLYWQGYLHNDNNDNGIDSQFNFSTDNATANRQIQNAIQSQSILLKIGTNSYTSVSPTAVGQDRERNRNNYVSYKYAAFANITSLLQGLPPSAEYTVANIPTRSGETRNGNFNDGLGTYGAWSLVVVYDNNTSSLEKTRNISVFDGYTVLSAANNPEQNITLSGFKTPSNAPNGVDSTLSVFAGEGDLNILGDYAKLYNQDGLEYDLPNAPGTASYFASAIEGVDTRDPLIANNNGIDIHTTAVGTSTGAGKPIRTNQTSATVSLGTTGDTFMPSMVAFATELFSPDLCYDYDVRIGEYVKINSENREIKANKRGTTPLTLTLLIRSEISDFPINNSTVNVTFSPSTLNYVASSSQVSPPDVNFYTNIGDINSALGTVGIGRGATSTSGGTIGALESTYIKQDFAFINNTFDGTFDITVNGTIQFDPNSLPVPYTLSTNVPSDSPNYIRRCNTNPVYDPIWSNFNIERSDSTASQTDEVRYPLYTQIAGKDFNISIVSYTNTGPSGKYDVELDTNATVELELINASLFDNNASAGYDSTCEEPASVGNGAFINFAASDGTLQSRVQVRVPQDIPGFNNDIALQSAAFRLWVLSTREANGTKSIVKHDCTLNGNCFEDLYDNRIESYDTNASCKSQCDTSYTAQGCYTCLKQHFATPICSRDNFSIRPESFRINISDNNESNVTNKITLTDNSDTFTSPQQALAAGYKYAIDVNATLFNSSNNAKAYYNDIFKAESDLTTLGSKTTKNNVAALEFADSGSCRDTTHRTYKVSFNDGKSLEYTYIDHNNVGEYNFWMLDSNWTNVDQSNYPHKARFGSCTKGDTRAVCSDCDNTNPSSSSRANGKLGCVINSNMENDTEYVEIPLRFEPYAYSVSNILMSTPNNDGYVYIHNNLDNVVYRDMSVSFKGAISAIGKDDANLSNYTQSCAAKDMQFDINTSITQQGRVVSSSNIPTAETIPRIVYLKKNYVSTDGTSLSLDNNESNVSRPIIIRSSEFKDENNGTADLKVFYNFERYANGPVNPINVTFIAKEANSTVATSAAHLQANYIPKTTEVIGQNIDFFYGRVVTGEPEYIVPVSQSTTTSDLFPEAYCDFIGTDCLDLHGLANASLRDPGMWHINTKHTSLDAASDIDRITDPKARLNINPNANIDLDPAGAPTPIAISIPPSATRTYSTTLKVDVSNSPWFDEADIEVTFLGGGGWAGPGKTGLVLESNASHDEYNKRTEW